MLGTDFMAKLSDQMQYFINPKISEDSNWCDVQVVMSGHEVPGEGEHKISWSIFVYLGLSPTTI